MSILGIFAELYFRQWTIFHNNQFSSHHGEESQKSLDTTWSPNSLESPIKSFQRQGIITVFALLRLCLYEASKRLIRLMHSNNQSTCWNIYSSPCCLPTWTEWLTGLFDGLVTSLDPVCSPSIPFGHLEQSPTALTSHFYILQGNYMCIVLSPSLNAELLKEQGQLPIHLLPSAPCSVPGSVACGESVDGMVIGKLPLRCDSNLPYFLIPKCFIVWSCLEGPRKTLSASPKVPCIFSSLHGYTCLPISWLLHSAISTPAFPSSTFICHTLQEAFPDNLTDISPFWLLLLFTLGIWAFTYKPLAYSVIHQYILCITCHNDY